MINLTRGYLIDPVRKEVRRMELRRDRSIEKQVLLLLAAEEFEVKRALMNGDVICSVKKAIGVPVKAKFKIADRNYGGEFVGPGMLLGLGTTGSLIGVRTDFEDFELLVEFP